MSATSATAKRLRAALRTVPGVRFYDDYSASVAPPALLLGPPSLTWGAACKQPTEGTFLAYLVVKSDNRAVERLWDLIESVTEVIENTDFASVTEANPLSFAVGGTDLAAYEITINAALGD